MQRARLRTSLCDLFGIEYPVLLAGMGPTVGGDLHGVAGPELVAAVSNAGGLGVLGGAGYDPETLERQIGRIRELTDNPFGVDILLPQAAFGDDAGGAREYFVPAQAREFLEELREKFGLPDVTPRRERQAVLRAGFDPDAQVEVILRERVPVLAIGLGDPAPYVPAAREAGTKVLGLVGNVRNARKVAAAGVDAIVAQGTEAGGHTGQIGTMALLPQVIDAVAPVPVVAAGGIADGRGLAATLAMGCVGVWCGTVFIATVEAQLDEHRKRRILEASAEDTRVTRLYSGKTMRNIGNELIEAWERSGMQALAFGLQSALVWNILEAAEQAGRHDLLMNAAGQISGMLDRLRTAAEVVEDMVSGAAEILTQRLPRTVEAGPPSP